MAKGAKSEPQSVEAAPRYVRFHQSVRAGVRDGISTSREITEARSDEPLAVYAIVLGPHGVRVTRAGIDVLVPWANVREVGW